MTKFYKEVIKNLPKSFTETIHNGMMGYVVPHSFYPNGYHCKPGDPLPFDKVSFDNSLTQTIIN